MMAVTTWLMLLLVAQVGDDEIAPAPPRRAIPVPGQQQDQAAPNERDRTVQSGLMPAFR